MNPARTLLFGPMDRHNLGDLLFPHIVQRLLGATPVIHAGLAARDLRPDGGHLTQGIAELAEALGDTPVNLIHVGGETLSCESWEAAALLAPDAASYARYCQADPAEQQAWANATLGIALPAPYVLPRELLRNARCVVHNAVGGIDLMQRAPRLREQVARALRQADFVGVRDTLTRDALTAMGVSSRLLPDCGVLVRELLDDEIADHASRGEVAQVAARFSDGYLALQCSSDFADDATLDTLALQMRQVAQTSGSGLVLFRAGAAPLHDDLALYRRLALRLTGVALHVFESRHILDICALIARSRGFAGSSLHGRIVALAYGLPRVSVLPPALLHRPNKLQAFVDTWQDAPYPVVAPAALAQAVLAALEQAPSLTTAQRLGAACRQGFAEWRALLAAT